MVAISKIVHGVNFDSLTTPTPYSADTYGSLVKSPMCQTFLDTFSSGENMRDQAREFSEDLLEGEELFLQGRAGAILKESDLNLRKLSEDEFLRSVGMLNTSTAYTSRYVFGNLEVTYHYDRGIKCDNGHFIQEEFYHYHGKETSRADRKYNVLDNYMRTGPVEIVRKTNSAVVNSAVVAGLISMVTNFMRDLDSSDMGVEILRQVSVRDAQDIVRGLKTDSWVYEAEEMSATRIRQKNRLDRQKKAKLRRDVSRKLSTTRKKRFDKTTAHISEQVTFEVLVNAFTSLSRKGTFLIKSDDNNYLMTIEPKRERILISSLYGAKQVFAITREEAVNKALFTREGLKHCKKQLRYGKFGYNIGLTQDIKLAIEYINSYRCRNRDGFSLGFFGHIRRAYNLINGSSTEE